MTPVAVSQRDSVTDLEAVNAAVDRVYFRNQPLTVKTISGDRPPFSSVHWTGDSRPEGYVTVPLPGSNVLTAEHAIELVRKWGYDPRAAFTSIARWLPQKADRGKVGEVGFEGEHEDGLRLVTRRRVNIPQPIPIYAVPARRTFQGYFNKDTVLRALAEMRCSHQMRMACLEVVFQRQSPTQVARKYRIGLEALKRSSGRLRARIRHGTKIQCLRGSERRSVLSLA